MVGGRIREARTAAGLTLEQLGARLGATSATVGRWERGRTDPGWSSVVAVARETGRPIAWFAGEADASSFPASDEAAKEEVLGEILGELRATRMAVERLG